MIFLPTIPSVNENSERKSFSILQPLYTCLSGLELNLTPPTKQSFKVKSEFKSRDYGSNL